MGDKEGTLYLKVRGDDVEVEVSLEAGVLTIVSTEKFELLHTFNVTPGMLSYFVFF